MVTPDPIRTNIMLERLIGSIVKGGRSEIIPQGYDMFVRAAVNTAQTTNGLEYLCYIIKYMMP